MIDSRSIDTILYWLINNFKFNKIDFSNRIIEKLPDSFDINLFKEHQKKDNTFNNLFIDFDDKKILFRINKIGTVEKLTNETFFAFPSIKNTRYILNTNSKIYKKSINYYNPFTFKGRIIRFFLKFCLTLNLKKNNIVIQFSSQDKSVKSFLSNHFYTGVHDGKRTIVSMIFSGQNLIKFTKISLNKLNNSKLINEKKYSKIFCDLLKKNKNILTPSISLKEEVFLSLDISSCKVSRPYNEKKDFKKLLSFLKSIHKNLKLESTILELKESINDNEIKHILNQIPNQRFYVAYAHGDLSPWNFYVSNKKLFVFDFETSSDNLIITYDLFIYTKSFEYKNPAKFLWSLENNIRKYLECHKKTLTLDLTKYYVLITMITHSKILIDRKKTFSDFDLEEIKSLIINYFNQNNFLF